MIKNELLKKIYKSAFNFEKESHGCAQATIKAIMDFFDIDDIVFKVASSCSGGLSNGGLGSCGGLLGGSLIIGYFFGRNIDEAHISGKKFKDRKLVNNLRKEYYKEFDGETCREVQKSVFGHSFDLMTEDGRKYFENENGHMYKCPNVVGKAAKWIAEILIKEGVPLKKKYQSNKI